MQQAPSAVFDTVYPALYGLAGYSEDDLSALRYARIPYCLKFFVGWLMQSVWRVPRWFVMLCQVAVGVSFGAIYWIPISNVQATMGLFFVASILFAFHDTGLDAHVNLLYQKGGLLFESLQFLAVMIMGVFCSFLGVSYYHPALFLVFGGLTVVTTPLMLRFKWFVAPLQPLRGVGMEILRFWWVGVFLLLYNLLTNWGTSMLGYWVAEVVDDQKRVGICFGLDWIGCTIATAFVQFVLVFVAYRDAIICAFGLEAVGVLIYMFLRSWTPISQVYSAFLFGGILLMATDAVPLALQYDASHYTRLPTFMLTWFQSIWNTGYVVGGIAFPLIKAKVTWTAYWLLNMGMCALGALVAGVLRVFVKGWRDHDLMRNPPTMDLRPCRRCGLCPKEGERVGSVLVGGEEEGRGQGLDTVAEG